MVLARELLAAVLVLSLLHLGVLHATTKRPVLIKQNFCRSSSLKEALEWGEKETDYNAFHNLLGLLPMLFDSRVKRSILKVTKTTKGPYFLGSEKRQVVCQLDLRMPKVQQKFIFANFQRKGQSFLSLMNLSIRNWKTICQWFRTRDWWSFSFVDVVLFSKLYRLEKEEKKRTS